MGIGSAPSRGVSGQRLYGHEPDRGWRGFGRSYIQVESAAVTVGLRLVATLVHAASGAPLKW